MSLADANNQQQYVNTCWNLFNTWGTLSPPERMNRLLEAVNTIFRSIQIPAFTASMGRGLGGSNAQLDFQTWSIQMDPGVMGNRNIDSQTLGDLAITMYHESRHGEQWYRVAQAVVAGICVPGGMGAVHARYGVTAQQIAAALFIPVRIALDAEQKKRFFPNAMTAIVTGWFNSIYGTNAAHRNATLGNLQGNYSAYRNLPEEVDAYATEQKIRALWKMKMSSLGFDDALSGVAGLFG